MVEEKHRGIDWMDLLWLLFLLGLALLPPVREPHKQLTLLAIGIVQLAEGRIIANWPRYGPLCCRSGQDPAGHPADQSYRRDRDQQQLLSYLLRSDRDCGASTLAPGARCSGPLLASAAYCSYLYPALQEYTLTAGRRGRACNPDHVLLSGGDGGEPLHPREPPARPRNIQQVAEQLTEANRQLERAQAEARRSERLAALGQLSAGLAHEIRNPLGVIKGSAETLQPQAGRLESPGQRAGGIHIERSEPGERAGDPLSRFCAAAAHRNPSPAGDGLCSTRR